MKINNHTNLDLTELEQQVDRFYPYSKQQLGFEQDPQSINFVSDPENATNMLGKTAFYDPESFSITIYADNRHPKDMMRSLSHELVHHAQNCRGEFDNEMDLGEGYAQEDEHMRNMEKEAYSLGNIVFRDWEDGMKSVNESMYGKGGKSFRRNREIDDTGDKTPPVSTRAIKGARFLANFMTKHPNMEPNDSKVLDNFIAIQNQRELERSEKDTAMAIINKYKTGVAEMIATPDTVKDAIENEDSEEDENLTLREAKIMNKRNKLEEMVLEYCQTKNFKTLSEVKQVRKVVEKILKENKEKADIDDDGKVSGWEKARSDAIQKNMDKEKTNEGSFGDIMNTPWWKIPYEKPASFFRHPKYKETKRAMAKDAFSPVSQAFSDIEDKYHDMLEKGMSDDAFSSKPGTATGRAQRAQYDYDRGLRSADGKRLNGPSAGKAAQYENKDTANLYEAPVTEADLEEEIELEEAFSDLEEVVAMGMDDEQTGNTMAQAKKEAGRTYSKAGKEAALQAQKKSMGITEEEVVEEDTLEEEEQLQEKTKDTGPKSRDRDEPDRHHKPKMESRRIAAKKSASQINESKFDKKFHDLVKKWCK